MITIEIPLWLVICLIVAIFIVIIYLSFGDLLARLLFKYLKEKDDKEEENKDE